MNQNKGIKTETIFIYNLEEVNGNFEENLFMKAIKKYDLMGNEVEYIDYDNNDTIGNHVFYEYLSLFQGKYKKINIYSKEKKFSEINFEYDSKMCNYNTTVNYSDGSKSTSNVKLNQAGNKISEVEHEKGNTTFTYYKYNTEGKIIEKKLVLPSSFGDILTVIIYEYDEYGFLIKQLDYSYYLSDFPAKTFYKNDASGKKIEELYYTSSGKLYHRFLYF